MNRKNHMTVRQSPTFTLLLAIFFSTGVLLLASFSANAEKLETVSISASSQWTNQLGSTLTITAIDSTGLLTGSYVNKAAGYPCKDTAYPVTGWIDGTAIVFNTLWVNGIESCNSITSWTGFYYNNQISTLWQLVEDGSTATSQIGSGNDTFTQKTSASVTAKPK